MENIKLFRLEILRNFAEIRSRPISFVFGIAFLLGFFFIIQKFSWLKFLSEPHSENNGPWIYFAWVFCLGTTLEICNGICQDISSGVISKIAQTPYGIKSILKARFFVSSLVNSFTISILALAFFLLKQVVNFPSGSIVFIIICLVFQCYAMMLILAGVTITQKSMSAAYTIGISVMAPLIFIPFKMLLGNYSVVLPISGCLELLKNPIMSLNQSITLALITASFVVISNYFFDKLLNNLKKNGKLLFV